MPVTLICTWGKKESHYLNDPPSKSDIRKVCDFSTYIKQEYRNYFSSLRSFLSVDSYAGPFQNSQPPTPFNLPYQMNLIGTYKFAIVIEYSFERDWFVSLFPSSFHSFSRN